MLEEIISSYASIKIVYESYIEELANNKFELCLPSFNYTPQQMFWIAATYNQCTKFKSKKNLIFNYDDHNLAYTEFNEAFSNLKEFSRDFNCKLNAKMNKKNKCSVI